MDSLQYLNLIEERKDLIKSLKLNIKDGLNIKKKYPRAAYEYIKNLEDFKESEIDELVDSIYFIMVYSDVKIVNIISEIKELYHEQEISEAKSHDQYPIHQIKINILQYTVNEYIKDHIPPNFKSNYDYLISYYIYDILEDPCEDISNLITNINIKSNQICDILTNN